MAGELSAIISVFLDDQATAGLQELPVEVQRAVTKVNAELASLGRDQAFTKVSTDAERATATMADLTNAIRLVGEQLNLALDASRQLDQLGASSKIGGLEQAKALTAELERQIALRREAQGSGSLSAARTLVANPAAANLADADLAAASGTTVENIKRLRQEFLEASAAAGDLVAQERLLEQQNARLRASSGIASGVLQPFQGGNASAQAEAAAASNRAEAAALNLAIVREEITGDEALATARARITDLTAEATAITTALTEVKRADAEATSAATVAEERRAAVQTLLNGESAQLQERTLAAARAQLQLAAANEDDSVSLERLLAVQQRAIASSRQLAAAEEQAAAAAAGGGGFFGGFGRGLTGGGHGGGGGLDAANIGKQIGEVARYIYLYEAFFKITEGIKSAIDEVKLFQEGLLSLDIALDSVNQKGAITAQGINSITSAATNVGASPGEGLQLAARGIQAFRDQATSPEATNQIADLSATAALQGQVLAGGKLKDVQTQLIAASREFNLGFQGQTRVLDAATNANRSFGASIGDILEGLSQVSGLAEQSGFSVEQLANAISLISSSTGLSGASAAGDLKRIIGGEGAPAFQKALQQVGVDTNQNLSHEIEDLGQKYSKLSDAQQQNVITTLGGRRAAEALIPLLAQTGAYQAANALSADNAGAAQSEFNKRQETLAGVLRQVSGGFKALATDIGTSGIGAGFGLALEALIPLLRALDGLIKFFDLIPAPIREAAFALGELAVAIRLVNGLAEAGIFSRIGGAVASKIGLGAVAGTAAPVATEAGLIGGTTAAGVGGAEVGAAAAGLGSLAATAGTAAIAFAALDGVIVAGKASDLATALDRANAAMDQIGHQGTTSDDLKSQVANIAKAQVDLRDKSKGFNGTIADFLDGNQADATIARLESFKKELNHEIDQIAGDDTKPGGNVGLFGKDGPGSVQDLDAKIKELQDSGRSAAGILQVLVTTIDGLTGAGQSAALQLAASKGAITTGANPAQFTTDILSQVPSNAKQFFNSAGLSQADKIALAKSLYGDQFAAHAGGDGGPGKLPASFGQGDTGDAFASLAQSYGKDFEISGDQRAKVYQQVADYLSKEHKNQPFAVLDKAEQSEIARILAEGLVPPGYQALLQKQLMAEFGKQAKLEASGQGRVKAFVQDPTLIAEAIKLAQSSASQAVSDATARGADSKELLGVAQTNLKSLQGIANDAKSAGIPETEQLAQALAEARKAAYDAFAARIDELAKIAESKLKSTNTTGKAALEAQAAKLKTEANKTDPTLLSSGFDSLNGAQTILTNATLKSAAAVQNAASAALRQAEADAAALNAEAAALEAAANSNIAFAESHGGIDSAAGNQAYLHASQQQAQADADRAKGKAGVAGAKTPAPKAGLNDPSADAGNQTSAAAASSAAAKDTAEQIAAARAAANVFPGAQVEQAAAAIQTAAADLHAQTPGTVAYYNALKSLHQAQYDYVQAVLAAQNVSRELGEDLTNPVVTATEALRTARNKLASDQRRGAPADVINADKLAVQQSTSALENTKFQQTLDTLKTNVDLGRITQAQYIHALDQQRDNLLAIQHRTYQQQQELNTVDGLLQEAAKAMQGQFNLGDIQLPSVFQVRQQVKGGVGAQNGVTQNVQVTVNGNDTYAMKQVLAQYLGPAAFARGPVATQKV